MAEVFDFGLQQHKIKMDGKFFENNLFAVAGDTGRRLEVQLLDSNNMVQNTTGISLRLNADVAGQATYAEAVLVDATKGLYELDLPNGMLLTPGNWQFQWQIIGTSGEKLHSFSFTGSVGSNLSEGGSEATNFYLNVDDLKQMQEDLVKGTFNSEVLETNIAEKLNNLEEQYAPKLTEVTAQLAQTEQELTTNLNTKNEYRGDLLEFIHSNSALKDLVIYRRSSDSTKIDVAVFFKRDKATVYTFQQDVDGWWRLFGCINRPMTLSDGVYTQGNGVIVMQESSRKEFAFTVKPKGSTSSFQWVPEHGNAGALTNVAFDLFIDSQKKANVSDLPTVYTEAGSVKLVSKFDAKHSGLSPILFNGRIDQSLNGKGMHISGKFNFVNDTEISSGFSAMFAHNKTTTRINKAVSDFGEKVNLPVSVNDGSPVGLNDKTSQIIHYTDDPSASDNMNNTVSVIKLHDVSKMMRYGKNQSDNPVYLQLRTDGERKDYFKAFSDEEVSAGEVYTFGVTYFCGELYNAKEIIK